jgi:hypothetical protein
VVRVTGTRFTVRERSVTVSRGSVRIESLRGDVLRARVGAGETWTFVEPAAATQPPATAVVATVVTPSVADARAVRPPERRADPRSDLGAAAPAPPPSPRARYEQAAALEARDADGALAVYSALAGENGPWAANATYAAARLESERGRRAEARALAEAYLRRWQDGPNAADARALLAEPTP